MRYLFFTIAAILIFASVHAQDPTIRERDSLVKILRTAKEDTNKVKLLVAVAHTYREYSEDSNCAAIARTYLMRSAELSEKLNYKRGLSNFYIASVQVTDDLDSILAIAQKLLALSREMYDKVGISTSYYFIAGVYMRRGQLENALEYCLRTDTVLRDMNDTPRLSTNLNKISGIYNELEQHGKAYEYAMRSLQLEIAAHVENKIGGAWLKLGDALSGLNRDDSAIFCYRKATTIYESGGEYYNEIASLVDMNDVLIKIARYDEVLQYTDTIIALSEKINRGDGLSSGYLQKGKYYFFKKQFALADTYAAKALNIALRLDRITMVNNCYSLIADIKLGAGDMPGYKKYKAISDSVHDAIVSEKILKGTKEIETKYRVEQKEHELILQQAMVKQKKLENTILIVVLLLLCATVIAATLSYRSKRRLLITEKKLQQQKIEQLETERQLVATKSVVQGQEEERSRLAKDLHDGLGGILSGAKYSLGNMKENLIITPETNAAFERTMHMLELSITEMRRVAHNMMPESLMKLNLDEALMDYCEQVTVSGSLAVDYQSTNMKHLVLNDTHKITVYRVVQELINNVAKHAAATSVIVQLFAKDKTLYLTVEDNGKGFDKTQLAFSSGIGLRNIKNRIDYLNGKLEVQSAPGKGTSVYIEIPLL